MGHFVNDPKDRGGLILRNLSKSLPDYMASHPRKLIFIASN